MCRIVSALSLYLSPGTAGKVLEFLQVKCSCFSSSLTLRQKEVLRSTRGRERWQEEKLKAGTHQEHNED